MATMSSNFKLTTVFAAVIAVVLLLSSLPATTTATFVGAFALSTSLSVVHSPSRRGTSQRGRRQRHHQRTYDGTSGDSWTTTMSPRWTATTARTPTRIFTSAEGTSVADIDQDPYPTITPATTNTTAELDGLQIEDTTTRTESSSSSSLSSSSTFPPTPTFRDCLAFTLPALGIWACPPLMSLIDASFIGRQSLIVNKHASLELAALGPASSISDSAPLPMLFLSIAATNLIAASTRRPRRPTQKGDGKEQAQVAATATSIATPDQARVTRVALTMGTVGGIILAVALYFGSGPLSALYCGATGGSAAGATATALTASYCQSYVSIRALALPAVVFTTIAQAVCIGTKDTSTPMYAVFLAAIMNLLGDFILVKKFHMGIAGAAWATSLSQVVAGGLLLRVLKRRGFLRNPDAAMTTKFSEDKETLSSSSSSSSSPSSSTSSPTTMDTIKQLLSFVPFLFVMTVKIGWHNSCAATAASLGGAQAAAHSALLSVAMLCFVLGDVGSSMSQAFLPAFIVTRTTTEEADRSRSGDGNAEVDQDASSSLLSTTPYFDLDAALPTIKQLLRCTLSISTTVMIIAATIIGIFPTHITRDPSVVMEMRRTLPWIVTALSFHGSAVTLEGLLLARKRFRPLSVIYASLAVGVAGFQLATRRFHWGLAGVWACYVWFCATRVVVFATVGGLLQPSKFIERIRNKFVQSNATKDPSTIMP